GSPGSGEGPGATRGHARTGIFLCPPPGGLSMGRGNLAGWAAPVGGSGVRVPAGSAATGDVSLQARPDPGGGVSVVAAAYPPAASSAYFPGTGGTVSRHCGHPARTTGASLYRGRPERSGDCVLV